MGNCMNTKQSSSASAATARTPSDDPALDAGASVPGAVRAASPAASEARAAPAAAALERQRDAGQARLRALVVSGAAAGDIDWRALVALAEELHRKERQLLRARRGPGAGTTAEDAVGGDGGAPRRHAARRRAFAERRRRRSAAARRRKLESVGSFSVNLSLYDGERGRGARTTWEETRGSDPEENAVEVFEDDTPSPSHRDRSRAAPSIATPRRPGTPAPCIAPITAYVDTGSFFEATSLFASSKGEDGASSDSSTASASQDKTWELRTVDEDATAAGW